MKKPHLLESSEELFQAAKDREISKPEISMSFKISGHKVLASFYLANDLDDYVFEIEKVTELELAYIKKYNEELGPHFQNKYIILCLAINNINRAKEFCSIEIDYKDSNKFAVLLNIKLRKILRIPSFVKEPTYKPSISEIGFLGSLDSVINNLDVDWEALSKYWKATKSKRYRHTIFEFKDLFSQAIRNIQRNS